MLETTKDAVVASVAVALLMVAGCSDPEGVPCDDDTDCFDNEICSSGVCQIPDGVDAGTDADDSDPDVKQEDVDHGDDIDNGDDSEIPEFYDELDDRELTWGLVAEGFCEMAWECPGANATAASTSEDMGRIDSKSTCLEFALENMNVSLNVLEREAALETGRIVVDRSVLADCRNALLDDACEAGIFLDVAGGTDEERPCEQVMTGTVEEGEYCNMTDECSGDLRCRNDDETADECYSVCTQPGDGDTTTCGELDCDGGEYCESSGGDASCVSLGEEGDECSDDRECWPSLFCSDDEVCTEIVIREEGESCEPGQNFCEPGTSCQHVDGQRECARPSGEGEECIEMTDCYFNLTCVGASGGSPGVCTEPEDGEVCDEDFHCDDGYCASDTDECQSYKQEGGDCSSTRECGLEATCDFSVNECVADGGCELPDEG